MRHIALLLFSTVLSVALLIEFGAFERVSYEIERGRIQAVREVLVDSPVYDQRAWTAGAVAESAGPAVVAVEAQAAVAGEGDLVVREERDRRLHDWLEFWREEDPSFLIDDRKVYENRGGESLRGLGSGFVVDAERGLVVTNAHVVDRADVVRVILPDGRTAQAAVVGADPTTDLAALRVDIRPLHELPLADDSGVHVGDEVLALGNPYGLEGSVSKGIVSAVNRRNVYAEGGLYESLIQTDAAISPGSSGGPLVNMRGEVIGIASAIATRTGGYDGVGFAIPVSILSRLLPQLVEGGPGSLGVLIGSLEHEPYRKWARRSGWEGSHGAVLTEVFPGRAADRAGLLKGDVLIEVDGKPVTDISATADLISETPAGTRLVLDVWRDEKRLEIPVVLGRRFAPLD